MSYHIRPIYNGKALGYCWESVFACSWVFCKQTAEPEAKACSGEASVLVDTKGSTLLTGVETSGYRTDSHLDLRVQCEENQKLYT